MINIGLMIYDCIAINVAYFLALWFRFDCNFGRMPIYYYSAYTRFVPIYTVASLIIFVLCKMYKSIWQYVSVTELARTIEATVICGIFHTVAITLIFTRMPITYYFFGILLQFIFTLGIRYSYRIYLLLREKYRRRNDNIHRVMLIGAGNAGQLILRDTHKHNGSRDLIVCVIDDNPNKWNRFLEGVPIIGGRDDILSGVEKYDVDKIYFAVPSAKPDDKRDILNICAETDCQVMQLPSLMMIDTNVTVDMLTSISVEDLLGRDPIKQDMSDVFAFINDKVIMVTGGGGSIGSELCRQVAAHHPKQLIIFDIYENNAYDIQLELKKRYPEMDLVTLIGSVRDSRRLEQVFEKYKPDVVYHAAAHKHVPLMEDSPCESIKNNVIGTYKTAYAAMVNGCKRFVLISTDKAVNPTNIMGASKRLCEMVIQSFDAMIKDGKANELKTLYAHATESKDKNAENAIDPKKCCTEYVAVRFGNVLGSNGSVIPIFKRQIMDGGPVTVTHPDIIRYFMTIPEAVSLVLLAGTHASSGDIYVLDMGEPVKIDTLARNLIKQVGLKPDEDIKIVYTGLRPGEKLYEEKLMDEEGLQKTDNDLIHIGCPIPFDVPEFVESLQHLMAIANENDEDIKAVVQKMVNTYKPADN